MMEQKNELVVENKIRIISITRAVLWFFIGIVFAIFCFVQADIYEGSIRKFVNPLFYIDFVVIMN